MRITSIIVAMGMASMMAHAQECDPIETAIVSVSGDRKTLSVDGDLMVLSRYVYRLNKGVWEFEAQLHPSNATSGSFFGNSVSVSGNYILVGSPGDNANGNGNNSGSAYIFAFDGTAWVEQSKITASDAGSTDFFGGDVAIWGSTAVVGAIRHDDMGTNAGAAYIFEFDGVSWNEEARLLASDGEEYDRFGISVAISDNFVVIGASQDDDGGNASGSAYVFHNDGVQWVEQAKLTADDADINDFFGEAVAVSGDTVLVGSFLDNDNFGNSGSAYVFNFDGKQWNQQAKLLAPDGNGEDEFGIAVAISGDAAIVGANQNSVPNSVAAYVFRFDGADWDSGVKLTSPGNQGIQSGLGVGIVDNVAYATGAGVHVFDLNCSCPADLTQDGSLNFFDVSAFLIAFTSQDPIADFTNDGQWNFFDVSAFLSAFSAGCP